MAFTSSSKIVSQRILHVVAGLEARYGGPSYSVPRLAMAQGSKGAEVTVASVADVSISPFDKLHSSYREIRTRWDGARVPILRDLRFSRTLGRTLAQASCQVDVVHSHGLWLLPNVQAAWAARYAKKPLIVAPRGMLAPASLAFSYRKKMAFWRLLQGPALKGIACIHATSDQERDEVRAFGLKAPVAVVPNGVDLPRIDGLSSRPTSGLRELLYLGRLHPKKSVDMLVEAWARVSPCYRSGWHLRIIGPSEKGYGDELVALIRARGLSNVTVEPAIYGSARTLAYARAELFVLPTRNENFGLTVAEALAAGTPAISTHGAPWSGLEYERCGWWTPYGIEALTATLNVALATPADTLRLMGSRGRVWVARAFSWEAVATRLLEVAHWLHNGGDRPEVVRID